MARRRRLSIALQTALGALSGAAGGYVQQEELKRRRQQEDEARKQQDFLTRFSLTQAGARPRQAPVPGAPEVPGAPRPSDYQTIGTFGDVEYEALTPEAKASAATAAEIARFRSMDAERQKLVQENWATALPGVKKALAQFNERELPRNVRGLIEAGGLGMDPAEALKAAFQIVDNNRRLNIEAGRVAQAGSQRGTYTTAEIRKEIAGRVSDFQKTIATATKEVPEMRKLSDGTEVPISGKFKRVPYNATERKALVDEFRASVEAEYASLLGAPTPSPVVPPPVVPPPGGRTTQPPPPVLDLDTLGRGGRAAPAAAPIAPPATAPRMPAPGGFMSRGVSGIGQIVGQNLPSSFLADFDRAAALAAGRPAAPFQPFQYTDSLGNKYIIR